MKIAYYMPFKAMGHANPSGDLVIGTEIFKHLRNKGNSIELACKLRMRWIYYKPLNLMRLYTERKNIVKKLQSSPPDIWLSYHSYYKAPDLIGPYCSSKLNIPYVIFQGIYSTKRRKKLFTLPGFLLNKWALHKADHIFTNKHRDLKNLSRIISPEKLTYIAPGIQPEEFQFSSQEREKLRTLWSVQNEIIIMTAAMMRPGVKTEGISRVIQSCAQLHNNGFTLRLVIAGDGECKNQLEQQANQLLPAKVIFLGKIPRNQLYKYYSSADIFAFPGIQESLGMVYLEAQSCKLPAVAFADWGAKEAIRPGETGLLSPASKPEQFTENIGALINNQTLRHSLGRNGEKHIQTNHNLTKNYTILQNTLKKLCAKAR
ncbi:MAG: glycosyltransferase involved in cell wall biosynthesis [Desulforhopalus sp.]|jgi:glycosyltransferase involved in cell wall biosynthesis